IVGIPIRIHTLAGLPYVLSVKQKRKLLVFIEKLTFKACTELWPNSFSLKKFILAEQLVDESKIRVIGEGSSNGVNLRSEEHTSELQSRENLVCRLLLEKKK